MPHLGPPCVTTELDFFRLCFSLLNSSSDMMGLPAAYAMDASRKRCSCPDSTTTLEPSHNSSFCGVYAGSSSYQAPAIPSTSAPSRRQSQRPPPSGCRTPRLTSRPCHRSRRTAWHPKTPAPSRPETSSCCASPAQWRDGAPWAADRAGPRPHDAPQLCLYRRCSAAAPRPAIARRPDDYTALDRRVSGGARVAVAGYGRSAPRRGHSPAAGAAPRSPRHPGCNTRSRNHRRCCLATGPWTRLRARGACNACRDLRRKRTSPRRAPGRPRTARTSRRRASGPVTLRARGRAGKSHAPDNTARAACRARSPRGPYDGATVTNGTKTHENVRGELGAPTPSPGARISARSSLTSRDGAACTAGGDAGHAAGISARRRANPKARGREAHHRPPSQRTQVVKSTGDGR